MPLSSSSEHRRGSRRQPEASRNAILQAALAEFAQEGLAGARVDAIADAAGVNKALLYYYFRDKETLYSATLDRFFAPLDVRLKAVWDHPGTAGERFLRYVKQHFDSLAASPYYARIFMGELITASRGGTSHLERLIAQYMRPTGMHVIGLLQEGIDRGEFRDVDPVQVVPSAIGAIVHYFLTAPLRQKFFESSHLPMPTIDERRAAVLDFIAAAVFADRAAGIRLAAKIAGEPNSLSPGEELPASAGTRKPLRGASPAQAKQPATHRNFARRTRGKRK